MTESIPASWHPFEVPIACSPSIAQSTGEETSRIKPGIALRLGGSHARVGRLDDGRLFVVDEEGRRFVHEGGQEPSTVGAAIESVLDV